MVSKVDRRRRTEVAGKFEARSELRIEALRRWKTCWNASMLSVGVVEEFGKCGIVRVGVIALSGRDT